MSRYSVRKGKEFERAVVRAFREVMPGEDTVSRGFQFVGGAKAADVSAGPFWIECKNRQLPNIRAALLQAESNSSTAVDAIPLAICKFGGEGVLDSVVAMRLDDFLQLVSKWWPQVNQ